MSKSKKKMVIKFIKFKLSDILELALKQLQAGKRSKTKMEYSCDAIGEAAGKFGKARGVVLHNYNCEFADFVQTKWGEFAEDYMGISLGGCYLFHEFYFNDVHATRKSQFARALFLTFGIMLLKKNPRFNNCTYTQPDEDE